jgi:hypothetical protein
MKISALSAGFAIWLLYLIGFAADAKRFAAAAKWTLDGENIVTIEGEGNRYGIWSNERKLLSLNKGEEAQGFALAPSKKLLLLLLYQGYENRNQKGAIRITRMWGYSRLVIVRLSSENQVKASTLLPWNSEFMKSEAKLVDALRAISDSGIAELRLETLPAPGPVRRVDCRFDVFKDRIEYMENGVVQEVRERVSAKASEEKSIAPELPSSPKPR